MSKFWQVVIAIVAVVVAFKLLGMIFALLAGAFSLLKALIGLALLAGIAIFIIGLVRRLVRT